MSKPSKGRDSSSRSDASHSDLTAAAMALDSELRRFDELANAASRVPLNSQKNLDRAAKATQEAAENQQRVATQLAALGTAITAAYERHQATALSIQERANAIRERGAAFAELLAQLGAIGEEASEINRMMRDLGTMKDARSPERSHEVGALLHEIQTRMARVIASADDLTKRAEAENMVDLARQGDALRQQVSSARNKVQLLQKDFPPPATT